ncbi:MAG: transcriptional regulator [Verrucomicrobiales bacterium]|nr:transcriptional regulator [Verrucomicrobiales bacterium]
MLWRILRLSLGCTVVAKTEKHRKILGENIRAARIEAGFSQEKLAEKAELHHNFIGDVERGEENISIDSVLRIASALKTTVESLVRGF